MTLWPHALRQATLTDSHCHLDAEGLSKMDKFASLHVHPNLKHFHTFGCPVFVLDSKLASNKTIDCWDSQAHMGVSLG